MPLNTNLKRTERKINIYLAAILIIIVGGYAFTFLVEKLNLRNAGTELPKEFTGFYDREKYARSQAYLRENTNFSLLDSGIFTIITAAFILAGGFNYIDVLARSFNLGDIATGLIFSGILVGAMQVLKIPFAVHHTFSIEEKYGFNKTTVKTFIADIIKTWLLAGVIGGLIFSLILWFFKIAGASAWFYCWVAVGIFELFIVFIAPVAIMPLFNKFIPMEDGELKTAIQNYADSRQFKLSGIFKMDGSKRSSKANAFFTGFGKFKRIVLFDTLIAKHTVDELVSILAHEIGHYEKKHIIKMLLVSFLSSGLLFFVLSKFLNNAALFAAFSIPPEHISIYAGIVFFGFLYSPISSLIAVGGNIFSRKWEFEADRYAVETYKKPDAFVDALKKLSVDNLSNLTPHPLKVFLDYSHPPVLERISSIRKLSV